jgi:hypothetical protein
MNKIASSILSAGNYVIKLLIVARREMIQVERGEILHIWTGNF